MYEWFSKPKNRKKYFLISFSIPAIFYPFFFVLSLAESLEEYLVYVMVPLSWAWIFWNAIVLIPSICLGVFFLVSALIRKLKNKPANIYFRLGALTLLIHFVFFVFLIILGVNNI